MLFEHKFHPIKRHFRRSCLGRCCYGMKMYTMIVDPEVKQERQALVPLKHVSMQGRIEAGHTTLDVKLCYMNLSEDNSPIECTFEMPIEQSTVVTKLMVQIDDRLVEAKIKAKEEAKE